MVGGHPYNPSNKSSKGVNAQAQSSHADRLRFIFSTPPHLAHTISLSTFTQINTLQLSSDPLFMVPTQAEIHCGDLI